MAGTKSLSMVIAASTTAFLMTACGSASPFDGVEISTSDLREQVERAAVDHGLEAPDDVSCSGALSLSTGAKAVCSLGYDDAEDKTAEVALYRMGDDGIGFNIDILD